METGEISREEEGLVGLTLRGMMTGRSSSSSSVGQGGGGRDKMSLLGPVQVVGGGGGMVSFVLLLAATTKKALECSVFDGGLVVGGGDDEEMGRHFGPFFSFLGIYVCLDEEQRISVLCGLETLRVRREKKKGGGLLSCSFCWDERGGGLPSSEHAPKHHYCR